jgi:hypothetical protein
MATLTINSFGRASTHADWSNTSQIWVGTESSTGENWKTRIVLDKLNNNASALTLEIKLTSDSDKKNSYPRAMIAVLSAETATPSNVSAYIKDTSSIAVQN